MGSFLVTGGSGFTGSRVVEILVNEGHQVIATSRSKEAFNKLEMLGAKPIQCDLDNKNQVVESFSNFKGSTLLNIASLGFGNAPNIVEAAQRSGIERAVFLSTSSINTKLATTSKSIRVNAEQEIMSSSLSWTILRPTMIYGAPGDRNIERLLRYLFELPKSVLPLLNGGNALQQPIFVDDLANVIAHIGTNELTYKGVYDLGGPEPLTLKELFTACANATGRSPIYLPISMTLATAVASLFQKVPVVPKITSEQVLRLNEDKNVDISMAKKHLDFNPRGLDIGLGTEVSQLFNLTK